MCKIEGCQSKPVAKDLCAKHYMRERRTGDASKTRKPGRKPDPYLTGMRAIMGADFGSRGTFSRYVSAMRLLNDEATMVRVINAATRPNGSINVAKLHEMAIFIAVREGRIQ